MGAPMTYCIWCDCPSHPVDKPCHERKGLTGQEMADAERRFARGYRMPGTGHVMGPGDPGDTSDLWQDGW